MPISHTSFKPLQQRSPKPQPQRDHPNTGSTGQIRFLSIACPSGFLGASAIATRTGLGVFLGLLSWLDGGAS